MPAFGNNDNKYHDNPIPESERAFFYNHIYNLWFQELTGNRDLISDNEKTQIKKTFDEGGYYRVDLNDKTSAIVLNSMYYDSLRNTTLVPMSGIGEQELAWLE